MLRVEHLHMNFGALTVTRDVSLQVAAGTRHAIIGPNGAGKTTLFNIIAGELSPSAGQIYIDNRDVTRLATERRARLGLMRSYQKNNLFTSRTVRDNLLLADIAIHGYGHRLWSRLVNAHDAHARAENMAQRVGLVDVLEQPVVELSYGAQRQLEVGLTLMGQPRILLLDEPTSGMSPEETSRMLALIDGLPRELAVLIIEHDMDLVFAHADRITVLNYGAVLLEGTPDEVRASQVVNDTYLGQAHGENP
jgi:branched-chain amino acid transport system ATP-binding protein